MTLDQLRIFLQVAALEHVTNAAGMLNMTQSAVSAAISALESRHGVVLFDRVGRRIVLTAAGRAFVPHAREVIRRAGEAEQFLTDLGSRIAGPLHLAASQTVASYWLPPALVRFRALHPDVVLDLAQGNTAEVAALVQSGAADLGVVEGRVELPGIVVTPLVEDQLLVLVGREHPVSDGRKLRQSDLCDMDWVLREQGSGTRAAFDAALRAAGLDPTRLQVLLELPSNEACIAATISQKGSAPVATVLSRRAATAQLQQGLLLEAGYPLPVRMFSVLWSEDRYQSRAARAFSALVGA